MALVNEKSNWLRKNKLEIKPKWDGFFGDI